MIWIKDERNCWRYWNFQNSKMDIIAPYTIRFMTPKRIVHIATSMDHLCFLHRFRPASHLLALPKQMKLTGIDECMEKGLDMHRLCSIMGRPNPIWSMEIVYYTPIKRLLIEDRLIDFESGFATPTLEYVDVQREQY